MNQLAKGRPRRRTPDTLNEGHMIQLQMMNDAVKRACMLAHHEHRGTRIAALPIAPQDVDFAVKLSKSGSALAYKHKGEDAIRIRYRRTDVLTFSYHPLGSVSQTVKLDVGEWPTKTTKRWMNRTLARSIGVVQRRFAWFVTADYERENAPLLNKTVLVRDECGEVSVDYSLCEPGAQIVSRNKPYTLPRKPGA